MLHCVAVLKVISVLPVFIYRQPRAMSRKAEGLVLVRALYGNCTNARVSPFVSREWKLQCLAVPTEYLAGSNEANVWGRNTKLACVCSAYGQRRLFCSYFPILTRFAIFYCHH